VHARVIFKISDCQDVVSSSYSDLDLKAAAKGGVRILRSDCSAVLKF
jgi:hypothetical protein